MARESNEAVVDRLIREASANNEYDNRERLEQARQDVLARMRTPREVPRDA